MSNKLETIAKISLITATLFCCVWVGVYISDNVQRKNMPIIEASVPVALSPWCIMADGVIYMNVSEIDSRYLDLFWNIKSRDLNVRRVVLTINSYGGSLADAFGFADMVVRMRGNGIEVVAEANGACMSAAVPVLAVCSYRTANENCVFMVHSPSPTNLKKKSALNLDGFSQTLGRYVKIMAENTNLSEEEWLSKVLTGDFFDSEHALVCGLIDEIM